MEVAPRWLVAWRWSRSGCRQKFKIAADHRGMAEALSLGCRRPQHEARADLAATRVLKVLSPTALLARSEIGRVRCSTMSGRLYREDTWGTALLGPSGPRRISMPTTSDGVAGSAHISPICSSGGRRKSRMMHQGRRPSVARAEAWRLTRTRSHQDRHHRRLIFPCHRVLHSS